MDEQLRALADEVGIETTYWDVRGERHNATAESLLAVMRAMAIDVHSPADVPAAVAALRDDLHRDLPGPIVVWGARDLRGTVCVPARVSSLTITLDLDTGEQREVVVATTSLPEVDAPGAPGAPGGERGRNSWRAFALDGPLPVGYHVLRVERGTDTVSTDVLVAPEKGTQLERHARLWGLFAPVYAMPGGTGLGAHIGDLERLAGRLDRLGGKILATLPLLAAYLSEPFDPSPYAPVSRRFWNELFVDLAALPELQAVPRALDELTGLRAVGHAANERGKSFDYRHQYGYVRGVLAQVVASLDDWNETDRHAFTDFRKTHPDVTDYARFRAFAERESAGWHAWPEPQRGGRIAPGDVDPAAVLLHEFGQYAMRRDLERLHGDLAGRGQRLYLDLPVGAHGDGYDTWKEPDLFAWGAGAGAPPDDFFAEGQNWGFPPLRPHHPQSDHLWHFRQLVRHHMEVAGILRLDHAMGLERLFWVPDGHAAHDGVYVRYPREQLFAVLAIESERLGCVLIGEDLGTVPDTIREEMDDRGILGMYVAQFNQPEWSGAELVPPSPSQLASIDTHDTPTFAGWLHGLDIDRRHVLGQLDDVPADAARAERRAQVLNLVSSLVAYGVVRPGTRLDDEEALLDGLIRFLGDSTAPAVLVAIDDLVGERNPQNVPGTMIDRPNWVQRVRFSAPELIEDPDIRRLLEALQGCRLGSHLAARDAEASP